MLKKKEKLSWADKTYGKVCEKCGKRHTFIVSHGTNLPNTGSYICEADIDNTIK